MKFSDLNTPRNFLFSKDYKSQLELFLNDYSKFIKVQLASYPNRNNVDYTLNHIDVTIDKLIDLQNYFDNGDVNSCYDALKAIMVHLKPFIVNKRTIYNIKKGFRFFRVRANNIDDGKSKFAIFHIPFNLRHLVSNQRFNPPGLPCLYCSTELSTAVHEMPSKLKFYPTINDAANKNDAANFAIFRNSRELSCLDFSFKDFHDLYDNLYSDFQAFSSYASIYPLIALLHIKQNYSSNWVSFRMEYVLPSFIMSWLFNQIGDGFTYLSGNPIHAFKYSSVKSSSPTSNFNFVFPSMYNSSVKYCSNLEAIFLNDYYYAYTDDYHPFYGSAEVDSAIIMEIESHLISMI